MTDERQRIVDRLGALEETIAPLKPAIKEAEGLRKTVRGWAADDDVAATVAVQYTGSRFDASVTACESRSRITSLAKLFKLLGVRKFLANCTFTLKALEETGITPPKGLVVIEPTGSREVHTVRKAA
jgi:hypothetical protein